MKKPPRFEGKLRSGLTSKPMGCLGRHAAIGLALAGSVFTLVKGVLAW